MDMNLSVMGDNCSIMYNDYELILCDYIMSMLWTCYTKGYIETMKVVWSTRCWDKHGWQRDTGRNISW